MSERFGRTAFPVVGTPPLTADDAAGDPLLTLLGAYLKAAVNAACGTAWEAVYPTESPVLAVRFQDPNDGVFDERDLPAIFLWRSQHELARIADDWVEDKSEVTALWIPPPSTLDRQTERAPFANAVVKAMARALSEGHDPAWVHAGDGDSLLPELFGSDLTLLAGMLRLVQGLRVNTVPITVETVDGTPPRRYLGARSVFTVEELLERDPSAWPQASPPAYHADVLNEEGATMVEREATDDYAEVALPTVTVTPPTPVASVL